LAHHKHNEVRIAYDGCCGYCGVRDEDTGGEFTVDHFVPTSQGGDDAVENLVYCCFRCNLYKADFHPNDVDQANGHVLIHPLRPDRAIHVLMKHREGRLDPLTETGRFHIALLHLNRPALVAYRLQKRLIELRDARRLLLVEENRELQAIIAAQQTYIRRLERLLDSGSSE